jgi:nuclear RNA export factor
MLDFEPVVKIAFDVPSASASGPKDTIKPPPTYFPCEMGGSLIVGVDDTIVSGFLARYFEFFDKQRAALQPVYHASATFSFSANTTIAVRSRLAGFQHSKEMPNQTSLEWGPWLNGGDGGSRNLERTAGNPDKAVKSLHIGNESIMRSLAALPGTVHEVAGAPEKFCIDAWTVGAGETATLFVNVHGQFYELPSKGVRSFDRTFILAPAAADSPARAAGWDVVILSDQLCIRGYASHDAWAPGPMRVQAGDPVPSMLHLAPYVRTRFFRVMSCADDISYRSTLSGR